MKRQRGRNRGGGGGSGGGGKPQQNANRAFDSNGPEGVKVRGNAQHVFDKYQQLARDAGSAGDRVLAENYLQHAEHYFRLLRAMQPQRPASDILGRDTFSSGYDIDFEDEGVQAQALAADEAAAEGAERAEREGQDGERRDDRPREDRPRDRDRGDRYESRQRDDRPRDDRPRDDRQRDDRARDDRPREDRQRDDRPRGDRDDRPRDDRPRDDRPRDDREGGGRRDRWRDRDDRNRNRDDRPRGERDDRPRDDRPRDDRPREDRPRGDRDERRDPLAVVEPQAQAPLGDERPAERAAPERPAAMLRDAEGGESHAPAFLQARAEPKPEAAADEEGARKPRRRRAPRTFEAGEGAPSSEAEDA